MNKLQESIQEHQLLLFELRKKLLKKDSGFTQNQIDFFHERIDHYVEKIENEGITTGDMEHIQLLMKTIFDTHSHVSLTKALYEQVKPTPIT